MIPSLRRRGSERVLIPAPSLCISRVRTSAGGLPMAKLVAGYDFSGINSTVTITGAGISNITDSSTRGNAAVQATDSRRMTYGSNTINGNLVGGTAGDATKHLTLPASINGWTLNGQPPFHFLSIFQITTWTNARDIVAFKTAGGAARSSLRLSTSGGNRIEGRTPTAAPGVNVTLSTETALVTGTTYLAELSVDGSGNASLIINEGTAATASSASSGESLSVRRIGDLTAAADIKIGAVYIFNDALTAPELAIWRTMLKGRWAY